MKNSRTTQARVALAVVLTAGMLLAFQNCGKKIAAGASDSNGAITVERAIMSMEDQNILKGVLSSYSSCSSLSSNVQQSLCMRSSLESSANATQKIIPNPEPDVHVCYVVGPACESNLGTFNSEDAMKLQACRSSLVKEGFTFEGLNQLMFTDPLGYAEMINEKCLFSHYQCVVAVRCILKSLITPSGV